MLKVFQRASPQYRSFSKRLGCSFNFSFHPTPFDNTFFFLPWWTFFNLEFSLRFLSGWKCNAIVCPDNACRLNRWTVFLFILRSVWNLIVEAWVLPGRWLTFEGRADVSYTDLRISS
ncbi:hypothetical protein BaRGS_00026469 [Batillaria attramentaria]|uniref:Uncharacterized protein n=1 Tax=Batillaria attramentaria TaxID=370345 RepID=A0ABD0K694_9CAEN